MAQNSLVMMETDTMGKMIHICTKTGMRNASYIFLTKGAPVTEFGTHLLPMEIA
jgi:hypothetical protein